MLAVSSINYYPTLEANHSLDETKIANRVTIATWKPCGASHF